MGDRTETTRETSSLYVGKTSCSRVLLSRLPFPARVSVQGKRSLKRKDS